MSTIKQQAIQRAINFLNAAGAQYAIHLDGEVIADTLPKAPEPAKKKRSPKNHFARDLRYVDTLNALAPGQMQTWHRAAHPCLAGSADWMSFCASVGSVAARKFQRDKMLIERGEEKFTLLRVE